MYIASIQVYKSQIHSWGNKNPASQKKKQKQKLRKNTKESEKETKSVSVSYK